MLRFKYFIIISILSSLTACQEKAASPAASTSTNGSTAVNLPKYKFNSDGALIKPENYRRWVYVGTPITPNDMNLPEAAFPDFHNVYIHPEDFEYWERNGKWQNGTILVKELVSVGKKQHVSGNGYFQGEFTGLEATIKDSKVFPDEPGYWAYFSFGHSYPLAETAQAFPASACNSCHAGNAEDDFVFTQDYPVLRAAKNSKNTGLGYLNTINGSEKLIKNVASNDAENLSSFIASK